MINFKCSQKVFNVLYFYLWLIRMQAQNTGKFMAAWMKKIPQQLPQLLCEKGLYHEHIHPQCHSSNTLGPLLDYCSLYLLPWWMQWVGVKILRKYFHHSNSEKSSDEFIYERWNAGQLEWVKKSKVNISDVLPYIENEAIMKAFGKRLCQDLKLLLWIMFSLKQTGLETLTLPNKPVKVSFCVAHRGDLKCSVCQLWN